MAELEQILNKLPAEIREPIMALPAEIRSGLEEIRLRAGGPIRVLARNREIVVEPQRAAERTEKEAETAVAGQAAGTIITNRQLETILNNLLDYSYYAYEEELARGYITIEGGHRVGVCGRTVVEQGRVTLIKEISSLNLRRSREIAGVAEKILGQVLDEEKGLQNTIIVSPPKCGKTTLLRDLVRLLSYRGYQTGVCDERSEIAGTYRGSPSYDLGPRTDVLDGCPKAEGMAMLIRAMSPDIVVTDEIGRPEDVAAIENALCAGVAILTTIHGRDYDDVAASPVGTLIKRGIFSRMIFLTDQPRTGTISEVVHV